MVVSSVRPDDRKMDASVQARTSVLALESQALPA
jgi:hypothetical protein